MPDRHRVGDGVHAGASALLRRASASTLEFIDEYLTTPENRPRFQACVRGLFTPLFQEIGFTSATVDSDERRALRATLIHTLGVTAVDSQIAVSARAAFDRALGGGPALDPTLSRAIVNVAARNGDATLFDAMLTALLLDAGADIDKTSPAGPEGRAGRSLVASDRTRARAGLRAVVLASALLLIERGTWQEERSWPARTRDAPR